LSWRKGNPALVSSIDHCILPPEDFLRKAGGTISHLPLPGGTKGPFPLPGRKGNPAWGEMRLQKINKPIIKQGLSPLIKTSSNKNHKQ
jgi:hypothetical protein